MSTEERFGYSMEDLDHLKIKDPKTGKEISLAEFAKRYPESAAKPATQDTSSSKVTVNPQRRK